MKKPCKDTIFNIKTAIFAAILVAVFIVCFFLILPKGETQPTLNESLAASSDISSPSDSSSESSSEGESSSEPQAIPITVSSPKNDSITVTDKNFSVMGSCDPSLPLYINDKEVSVTETGDFSDELVLSLGKNTIKIKQGDTVVTKTVTYRYVVIKDYSPAASSSYTSGSNMVVSVTARKGSTVTATLNSKTVTLTPNEDDNEEGEFIAYFGMFTLPKDNLKDLNIGKIKFTGKFEGVSESFYSGNITVKKTSAISSSDSSVTPTDGGYINVGSGYIAEIIEFQAETFDGKYTANNADWSMPTNSYLPKGTVDYCSTGLVYDSSGEQSYVTLRCGKRVYFERTDKVTKETSKVVKQYVGKLPDHNELSVAELKNDGKHTKLVLNTDWKAPFKVSLEPQGYVQPSSQDYRIESATFTYIDITFCYATVFSGEIKIPEDHPVFKSAEIIQKKSEYVLRLCLKEKGEFYGWDASYNDKGQLCFSFLNPSYTVESDNEYGRDLSGITILIDVGHGGKDIGAAGINPQKLHEANANLKLAKLIAEELKNTGATVVLTRTTDVYLTADERHKIIKELSPDLCIAIHHDANDSSSLNGFGSFYYNAFSKKAAEYVYNRTIATGLYNQTSNNRNRLDWHYFFLARATVCPVVLTENGYMTNSKDFASIVSDDGMKKKAKAIVKGVADYFKDICPEKMPDSTSSEETESKTSTSLPVESTPVESLPAESTPIESKPTTSTTNSEE